jgi:adenylate cyclase
VDRVRGARPAAVGLNLLFPEADGFSGVNLTRRLPGLAARTAAWVASVPDGDHALGRALAATPSVIGLAGLDGPAARLAGGLFTPAVVRGEGSPDRVRHYRTVLRSVADIDAGAAGHALLNADGGTGVLRRLPLVAAVGDTLVPGLAVEVLRVAAGAPAFRVQVDARGVRAVGVGDVSVPAEADGTMWVHFTPHDPARFVSAGAVLAGEVPAERLERRLVLVGVTALGLGDYHVTPLGERQPGVEIHAQALENLFDGRVLRRPRWAEWAEAAALIVTGGLVVMHAHPDRGHAPRGTPGPRSRRSPARRQLPGIPGARVFARRPHAGARAGDRLRRHPGWRACRSRPAAPRAAPAASGGA